jgi:hypothetical protein
MISIQERISYRTNQEAMSAFQVGHYTGWLSIIRPINGYLTLAWDAVIH